jgi:hypothetical protein
MTRTENTEHENTESESEQYESVYFKYEFEHCESIDDILQQLEHLTHYFKQLKDDGYRLLEAVNNGYCFIDKQINETQY